MYKETWNKYKKGFKFLLPFILINAILNTCGLDLNIGKYEFTGLDLKLSTNLNVFKQTITNNFTNMLLGLLVGTVFFTVSLLVIKDVFLDKNVSYIRSFKESISYYAKFLVLSVVLESMFIAVQVLGTWGLLTPITMILSIYLSVVLAPCAIYLMYHKSNVLDALRDGITIGRKNFGAILLLNVAIVIAFAVPMALLSKVSLNNPVVSIIFSSIASAISMYCSMFVMSLCESEEHLHEKEKLLGY